MITVARCHDADAINAIISSPEIAPWICDDGSHDLTVTDTEALVWLGVYLDGLCFGVFLLVPQNAATVELHTALALHGRQALDAARLMLGYVFAQWHKLVTQIPADNRPAALMARRLGLKHEGINRQSFLKSGVLLDQSVFGMTREEYVTCHYQQR